MTERHCLPPEAFEAITITPYEDAMRTAWDECVLASRNGTLYHTRAFLSYHPSGRFTDRSLCFYKKGRLIGLLPAAIETDSGSGVLCSHPGASYGGLVLAREIGLRDAYVMLAKTVDHARKAGMDAIHLLRVTPACYHERPSHEIEFAATRLGFVLERRELTSAVDLALCGEGATKHVNAAAGRSVRKAIKEGVTVRESPDLARFWEILTATLAHRHGSRPTHTLAEIRALAASLPGRIRLFGAYRDERLIAGVVIFVCNPTCCYTMYHAQDYAYQALRPLNLVIAMATEWAAQNAFRYLDLGISTERGGQLVNWELYRFKENLGACGVLRDSYKLAIPR